MLHSDMNRIFTNHGDIASTRILAVLSIMMIGFGVYCPLFYLRDFGWLNQLTPDSMILFPKIGEVYGIVAGNSTVHRKISGESKAMRRLGLIVINILNEGIIITMVGREPSVSKARAIEVIEKYIGHFTTNDFPSYGDRVWKDMSNELDGKWAPRTVYNHVRENKRGDLTEARNNQQISVSPSKPKHVLIDDVSDGEDEASRDLDDNEEWLPEEENEKFNLQTFDVLLTPDEWAKIRPTEEAKDRLKSKAWAPVIANVLKKQYNFECAFLARASHVRVNFDPEKHEYFLKVQAYCADKKKCKNVLQGIAESKPTENGLRLTIHTVDTRINYHRPVTRPLNGTERNEVKAKLSRRKAANYRNEQLREEMQFGENIPFHIRENHIYRQVKMEGAQEQMGRKPSESIGVIQSLQKMATSPLYKGTIHDVGAIRFYIIYCTLEQILAYQEYVRLEKERSEIAIDASGKMVRAFEICPGKKTGHIFLYTITIRYKSRTICLCQVLTEIHTQEFIEYWLKSFKRLGAPAPGRAVSDYERAIPMSSCLTFNNMSFKEYIDTCYLWALSKEKKESRPAKTLILIDVAHIMHLAACWKSVKNERHKTVKETRLYCVALMIDTRTVEEFAKVFVLTNVISSHPFSDTITKIDGVTMKVSDALHQLQDAIGNRKTTLKSLEESMSVYEENKMGEQIPEFEEGENDTLTHKFIKQLINKAKPSPSDIEGTTVNGFYNEEFIKALERMGKEFPAWTGVTEPNSYKHASSAYQEGYFANLRAEISEGVKLPCRIDRFISEHLKSLKSGSNQFSADLKHANHERAPHPPPIQVVEPKEISSSDATVPQVPLKKFNLADDSDLKSYEPWGGLKNQGPFLVESESSEDEDSREEKNIEALNCKNRKSSQSKVLLADSHNFDCQFHGKEGDFVYNEYESSKPVMADVVKVEETETLYLSRNKVCGTDDPGLQSFKSTKSKNMMEERLDNLTPEFHIAHHYPFGDSAAYSELMERKENHISLRRATGSHPNNFENKVKLPPHEIKSLEVGLSNSICTPLTFTSSPLADHSYAALLKPDDHKLLENMTISRNDATAEIGQQVRSTDSKSERNFRPQSSDYTVDEQSIVTVIDKIKAPAPHPLQSENIFDCKTRNLFAQIQGCKRKMEQMNPQKCGQKKKLKDDKDKRSKQPGHYFQDRKELRILNQRLGSKKKGLLLTNGNVYTKTIKIKRTDKFQWKFDPKLLENGTLPNQLKGRVLNTCDLDSILHILQFCAIDYPIYQTFMSESSSGTLKFLMRFMNEGLTENIQLERLKLLNKVYDIKEPKIPLYPYYLDAEDSAERIWKEFMEDEPSAYRNFKCNNPACSDVQTEVRLINVNEGILRKKGYKALEKALLYNKTLYKVACKKRECSEKRIVGEEETTLNVLICINLDVRGSNDPTKTMEGQLDHFPLSLELEETYRLVGIVHHEPGHFTAYCRRDSGSWILCDDMKDKINYDIKATNVVMPHLVMYVIELGKNSLGNGVSEQ